MWITFKSDCTLSTETEDFFCTFELSVFAMSSTVTDRPELNVCNWDRLIASVGLMPASTS
jgi:hypothetical protein